MLDTNVFNRLLDGLWDLSHLPDDAPCYVTHVQRDELAKTRNQHRRDGLLAKLKTAAPTSVLTETMIVGISRVGGCRISDGVKYEELVQELTKRKKQESNLQDALIAEAALKSDFTLVSADSILIGVMAAHSGKTLKIK